MERRDDADQHGAGADGRRSDIGNRDLSVREQAEQALVAWAGAAEIMGLPMRRADRQNGGVKQQDDQQTSERWLCNERAVFSFLLQVLAINQTGLNDARLIFTWPMPACIVALST
jgi:hypothetical protein